jgi:hypothetical protein
MRTVFGAEPVGEVMNAWLWVANPVLKWRGTRTPDLTPFEALHRYLAVRYVYWATPDYQRHIRAGDPAYIWLSENGIIAAGEVAEPPQRLTESNRHSFRDQEQLEAPGWKEARATSDWKTGIGIEDHWERPLMVHRLFPVTPGAKTIVRLNEDQHQRIISAIQEREG